MPHSWETLNVWAADSKKAEKTENKKTATRA